MAIALKGTLDSNNIVEVVKRLVEDKATGLLLVSGESEAKVYFRDGEIIYAVSDEGIGAEVLPFLVRWVKGTFSFSPGIDAPGVNITESTTSLLEKLLFEASRWSELKEAQIFPRSLFSLREEVKEEVTLSPFHWRVVTQLKEGKRLEEVAEALNVDFFDLGCAVLELMARGLVERQKGDFEDDIVQEKELEQLKNVLKELVGPVGDIFWKEAVDWIAGEDGRVLRRDFPKLVDYLSQNISDQAKIREFQKKAAAIFSKGEQNEKRGE